MTNITEKNNKTDVQLHIDKAFVIINRNLPNDYANLVLEKIDDVSLTTGIIRNIKNRVTKYPSTRINVINALVEVALKYQSEVKKLKRLTK